MNKSESSKTKTFLAGFGIGLVLGVGLVLLFTLLSRRDRTLPELPPDSDSGIQIIIKESYINQMLAAEYESDPLFSNILLDLRPPNLALVTVYTEVFGIVFPSTVTIQFRVEAGEIQVDLLELDVGGFNIPTGLIENPLSELEKDMQYQTNALIDGTLANTNLQIINVSANETSLLIEMGE